MQIVPWFGMGSVHASKSPTSGSASNSWLHPTLYQLRNLRLRGFPQDLDSVILQKLTIARVEDARSTLLNGHHPFTSLLEDFIVMFDYRRVKKNEKVWRTVEYSPLNMAMKLMVDCFGQFTTAFFVCSLQTLLVLLLGNSNKPQSEVYRCPRSWESCS